MEFIPTNRILHFNTNQLKSVRKQYNLDKPGDMSQAIDVLEAWIKMQEHFTKKEFPRSYLEKIIISSKGSLERAKSKLDKICTLRTALPEFFGENLTKNKFEDLHNVMSSLLPMPTDENYRVYLMKTIGSTFTSDLALNYYRFVVLICEYFMAHDYSDGLVIVIDYTEASVTGIIKALNFAELRQITAIVIGAFAMRLKGIHLITSSKAIDAFVTIIKQFISPKLAKRILIHKDINSVYQYVPKDMFPVEFGGMEKSFHELRDELMNELTGKDFINHIEEMNKAMTDEKYRQTDTSNDPYLNMPGSFRTLNVD